MKFLFDKSVLCRDWKTNNIIAKLEPFDGLGLMARSIRFDCDHATAAVRTLNRFDAHRLGVTEKTPVIFEFED